MIIGPVQHNMIMYECRLACMYWYQRICSRYMCMCICRYIGKGIATCMWIWSISAHQRSHSFYSVLLLSSRFVRLLPENLPRRWSRESWSILRNLIFSSLFSTKIWHFSAFQAFPYGTSWKVWQIWECCDGLTPMSAEGWDAHVMQCRHQSLCNLPIQCFKKLRRIVVGLTRDILQNMCVHTCSSQANCLTKTNNLR